MIILILHGCLWSWNKRRSDPSSPHVKENSSKLKKNPKIPTQSKMSSVVCKQLNEKIIKMVKNNTPEGKTANDLHFFSLHG